MSVIFNEIRFQNRSGNGVELRFILWSLEDDDIVLRLPAGVAEEDVLQLRSAAAALKGSTASE